MLFRTSKNVILIYAKYVDIFARFNKIRIDFLRLKW